LNFQLHNYGDVIKV